MDVVGGGAAEETEIRVVAIEADTMHMRLRNQETAPARRPTKWCASIAKAADIGYQFARPQSISPNGRRWHPPKLNPLRKRILGLSPRLRLRERIVRI